VALSEKTKKEDERLRKELENADLKKFDKAIKVALSPVTKSKKRSKTTPK
jgi:hypothetical protein